jgi:hypothetical protein
MSDVTEEENQEPMTSPLTDPRKHFLLQHRWTYNDVYLLIPQDCNFSKVRHRLPDDGPDGPKHAEANMRYFNVHFNILYV